MNELLIILTSLFGGLNIFQFLFFRAERKKAFATAEGLMLDNEQKKQDLHQGNYDYLTKRCDKLVKDYFEMMEKAQTAMDEAAKLRSEITYLKGLRCYVTICQNRIQRKEDLDNHENK